MILIDLQSVLDAIVPERAALANSQKAQIITLSQDSLDVSPEDHLAAQTRLQRSTRKIEALDLALDKICALDVYDVTEDFMPDPTPNPLAGE